MRLGIDLGGTKIEGIIIDEQGYEVWRERVATPANNYQPILNAIVALVKKAEKKAEIGRVGIGIPGVTSPATGLIKNANTTSLIGQRLDLDLAQMLGKEIRLANDANCFALSEATDGAGAKANSVFGVILGTGVGGGLIVDKQVIAGSNLIAGEWGHNEMPYLRSEIARDCYCGKKDCIETYLCGPSFEQEYNEKSGLDLKLPEIISRLDAEPLVKQIFENYCERLAAALSGVINIFDPEVIVLGGGLSNISRIYEVVPQKLPKFVFSDSINTTIVANKHGDSSGVRGAAWLWPAGN